MPAKISVNIVKSEIQADDVLKFEEPDDTSAETTCSPQYQSVTSTLFSAPAASQVKRKWDDFVDFDNYSEKETRREELLEQFLQQVSKKETQEQNYKKRKEKRDQIKLKTLQRMVSKLETLSKTQEEILGKQESVIGTVIVKKK